MLLVKKSLTVRTEPAGVQRRFDGSRVRGGKATAVEPSLAQKNEPSTTMQFHASVHATSGYASATGSCVNSTKSAALV